MESFLNMVEDNYPIAIPKYLKEHYLGYSKEKQAFIKKMIWQIHVFVLVYVVPRGVKGEKLWNI